jgi:hypothetical protein
MSREVAALTIVGDLNAPVALTPPRSSAAAHPSLVSAPTHP